MFLDTIHITGFFIYPTPNIFSITHHQQFCIKILQKIKVEFYVLLLLCLFIFKTIPTADMKTTSEVEPAEMNGSGFGGHPAKL